MEVIPYLMELGKLLGWPAVVVAVIMIFVIRDLTRRVEKLEKEKEAIEKAVAAKLEDALSNVTARLEKLESADNSIKSEFKEELNKIYEKINTMSANIAVLKDRSDRKEKKEHAEG